MYTIKRSLSIISSAGLCLLSLGCGSGSGSNETLSVVDTASCAETVSADITEPTTWLNTASDCDYYVTNSINISKSLTIEPGTTIVMAQDTRMFFSNALDPNIGPDNGGVPFSFIAVGTPEQRITIKGEVGSRGFWQGILMSYMDSSQIEYVDIIDGGQPNQFRDTNAGLDISFSTSSIIDVTVSNSGVEGLKIGPLSTITAFTNNTFFGNRLSGLSIPSALVPVLDEASDYHGSDSPNGRRYINVVSSISPDPGVMRWKKLNAPYGLSNIIRITQDQELIIAAGTEIVGLGGSQIDIWDNGIVRLEGTADNPIQVGPNGNPNDTPATNPLNEPFGEIVGFWRGFDVTDDGQLFLDHVIVDFTTRAAVFVQDSGRAVINNSVLRNGNGWAIFCYTGAEGESSGLQIVEIDENTRLENHLEGDISPDCVRTGAL